MLAAVRSCAPSSLLRTDGSLPSVRLTGVVTSGSAGPCGCSSANTCLHVPKTHEGVLSISQHLDERLPEHVGVRVVDAGQGWEDPEALREN